MLSTQNESRPGTDEGLFLFPAAPAARDDGWFAAYDEGQLSIDALETDREIIIRSAIAGVRPEDLEVFVQNDMLTVRGRRQEECVEADGRYIVRECHWGAFSRSIILSSEVDAERITATLKNGVLTVRLPKAERTKKIAIKDIST